MMVALSALLKNLVKNVRYTKFYAYLMPLCVEISRPFNN